MIQVDSFFDAVTPNFLVVIRGLLLILLLGLSVYYLINIGNQYIDKSKRIRFGLRRVGLLLSAILLFIIIRYVFHRFPVLPTTLAAIVISIILAYIINPLVSYLETKKISRRLGVLIVYVGFVLIFVVLFLVVLPKTIQELRNLFKSIPNLVNDVNLIILYSADHIEKVTNIDMRRILKNIQD